jgi:hypothetical protein
MPAPMRFCAGYAGPYAFSNADFAALNAFVDRLKTLWMLWKGC